MGYAHELMLSAEADFHERRAGIEHHAASLDALGELLSSARGIKWNVCRPDADISHLILTAGDPDEQRLFNLLLEHGATVERKAERVDYTHYSLQIPGVSAGVIVLVPRHDPHPQAQALYAQEAA